MRFPVWLLAFAVALLSQQGCGAGADRNHENDTDSLSVADVCDMTDEADKWADSLLGTMTPRQRVGQLFMPALYARADVYAVGAIREYACSLGVGGVLFLKGDVASARALADTMTRLSGVYPFVAIDAEWGLGMRLHDAPSFPVNGDIAMDADESLLYDYGYELARECRLAGINMVLGPVVDVGDRSTVIGRRSFGGDAKRVARLGVAYARGVEDGGVISVAKHFPGHGSSRSDSHQVMPRLTADRSRMDTVDLLPFREYIAAGLSGVMVGHIHAPALDSIERPAAFSRVVIRDELVRRMRFGGIVLTDAVNMGGASGYDSADAISAGADVILAPLDTEDAIDCVVRAVEAGRIRMSRIDESCRKLLFYKYMVAARNRNGQGSLHELSSARSAEISRRLRADSCRHRNKNRMP